MSKNIQGTYYLTEKEHQDFKVKCIIDKVSMTEKIRSLIKEYLTEDSKSNK